MKGDKFYDNGFSILKESEKIGSPIGTIFFEYYNDKTKINRLLKINVDKDLLKKVEGFFFLKFPSWIKS